MKALSDGGVQDLCALSVMYGFTLRANESEVLQHGELRLPGTVNSGVAYIGEKLLDVVTDY